MQVRVLPVPVAIAKEQSRGGLGGSPSSTARMASFLVGRVAASESGGSCLSWSSAAVTCSLAEYSRGRFGVHQVSRGRGHCWSASRPSRNQDAALRLDLLQIGAACHSSRNRKGILYWSHGPPGHNPRQLPAGSPRLIALGLFDRAWELSFRYQLCFRRLARGVRPAMYST